jgi:hypothetical protein
VVLGSAVSVQIAKSDFLLTVPEGRDEPKLNTAHLLFSENSVS